MASQSIPLANLLAMDTFQLELSSSPRSTPAPPLSQSPAKAKYDKKAPSLKRPQQVVKLLIGEAENQEVFYIHRELLCYHSSFFASAFTNPAYLEAETQSMTLPDISSEDFGAFVHWLYFQKIELDGTSVDVNILPLARLWVLGGRFRVAKLQNKVMDKLRVLVEGVEGGTLKGFLNFCYEDKERAELRKLAADRMAWTTTPKGLEAWISQGHLPEGILVDIVLALRKDHVSGKPSVKFNFGEARDYYVGLKEKEDETKMESEGEGC